MHKDYIRALISFSLAILILVGMFTYFWITYKTPQIAYISISNSFNHDYIVDVYDCSEFSEMLIVKLRMEDINAISVCGYMKNKTYYILNYDCDMDNIIIPENLKKELQGIDSWHRWVYLPDYNIHIDATNGEVISKFKNLIP